MTDPLVRFQEVQHFTQWWIRALIALIVIALAGATASINATAGDNGYSIGFYGEVLGVVGGVAAIAFLLLVRLTTEVRDDGVHLRFRPFVTRTILWDEIESAETRTYRPIREFGGWGVRWGPGGRALNVSGNQGVQLMLRDGKRLLIGSQRAAELAAAINEARS